MQAVGRSTSRDIRQECMHAVGRFTSRDKRQICMQWEDLLQETYNKNVCSGKIYSKRHTSMHADCEKINFKRYTTRMHAVARFTPRDIRQVCMPTVRRLTLGDI